MNETKTGEYRQIFLVFVALAVLTGLEFIVSTQWGSAVVLILIGLVKAGLIVHFFMHAYRLWREEEH